MNTYKDAWEIIEKIGECYVQKTLINESKEDKTYEYDHKKLDSEWKDGLNFFWGHAFMRGRSDTLSGEYMRHTCDTLYQRENKPDQSWEAFYGSVNPDGKLKDDIRELVKIKKGIGRKNMLSSNADPETAERVEKLKQTNVLIEKLTRHNNGKKYLNNDRDLIMVLEAIEYTNSCNGNIYANFVNKIIKSPEASISEIIDETYKSICKIHGCADKIATFFLRDVALLNENVMNKIKKSGNYAHVFPIDTWVTKGAIKLGYDEPKRNKDKSLKDYCINECLKNNLCPAKVNAGLWYSGAKSFDLLMSIVKSGNVKTGDLQLCDYW